MQENAPGRDVAEALGEIFSRHKTERICVLGTTCCGKSTLHERFPQTQDMDELLWPTLTWQEEAYICQKPWTEQIGAFTKSIVKERLAVQPGRPMFSLILLDCDVIVYLDIDDALLKKRCELRGSAFRDAKNVKDAIEHTLRERLKTHGAVFYRLYMAEL